MWLMVIESMASAGLVFYGPKVITNSVVVPPGDTTDSEIDRIILQVRRRQQIKENTID